jgi:basic membrane protein A
MKKLFVVILLSLTSLLVLSACEKKSYEIALVTDVGNIDDKSFNEGSWNGVKEYGEASKVSYAYYRPSEDSTVSRAETIKSAIDKGAKIVVCPGFLLEEAVYELQGSYPNVAFLLLDGEPHSSDYNTYKTEKNTHNILYREEQGGYLAGYAAIKEGYKSLGFIGGIDVPAVTRFGFGYVLGADAAAKELNLTDVSIRYNYAGTFTPTDDLKTKMDGWYSSGTEVVFACGGAIYLNVTKAAEQTSKKVIGVDSDQASASATVITSAMKNLTLSVKMALDSFFKNGKAWDEAYAGKTATLGVAEDCIGLPTNEGSWRFKNYTVSEYNTLFAKLKDGTIVVPNQIATHPTTEKVTVNWAG